MRARTSGSSGDAKGSFSMMTSRSASPFTSTPSQKLAVPSSTPLPSARNSSSSRARRLDQRAESLRDVERHEAQRQAARGHLERARPFELVNRRDPRETRGELRGAPAEERERSVLLGTGASQGPRQLLQ